VGGIEKTVCSECDMRRASGVLRELTIRKICQGRQLVFFHEVLVLLEWIIGKFFEKITNDLTNPGGLEVMRMECFRLFTRELLDVSAKNLFRVVRLSPTYCPHQATPNSRTGVDRADELLGVMEEGGKKIEIILLRGRELVEWGEFDNGYNRVFIQGIPNNIEPRMEEAIGLSLLEGFIDFLWSGTTSRLVVNPWDVGVKLVWGKLNTMPDGTFVGQACLLLKLLPILLFLLLLISASGFFLTLITSSIMNYFKSPGQFQPEINHFIIICIVTRSERAKAKTGIAKTKGRHSQFGIKNMREERATYLWFVDPIFPRRRVAFVAWLVGR